MTTELPNMAAILQKRDIDPSLVLDIRTLINWHMSKQGIRWPVSHDHIVVWSLQLIEVTCFCVVHHWPSAGFPIGSWAHVKLTCWKHGSIVLKPDWGFKVNWILTFSSVQLVFLLLFCVYGDFWNLKQKAEEKPDHKVTKLKSQLI